MQERDLNSIPVRSAFWQPYSFQEKKKSQLGVRTCQDVLSAGVVLTAGPC